MLAILGKFFSGTSITTYLAIGFVLVALGYFFYSQHEIKTYAANQAVAENAIKDQKEVIKQLQEDAASIKKTNEEIQNTTQMDNDRANKLSLTLTKLSDAIKKNPSLVEASINRGTAQRLRCIEISTGSKPKKGEKNSVCPQLLHK